MVNLVCGFPQQDAGRASFFEVYDLPDASAERRDASMALNEMLTLIAVIFSFAGLMVEVVNTTFNITWKISHERKDKDSKKSE